MKTIIDYLSDEAKEVLKEHDNADLGVISTYLDTNSSTKNKTDLLYLQLSAHEFGKYKIKEYDHAGKLNKVSLLLVGGDENGRRLAPFLKKQTEIYQQPYFVFKPFNKTTFSIINNPNIHNVKYNYDDVIVKLAKIESFFNQHNTEY